MDKTRDRSMCGAKGLVFLLDNCSFSAPCCCEHYSGGEADPQIVLVQTQQISAVLESVARLVFQDTATWQRHRFYHMSQI